MNHGYVLGKDAETDLDIIWEYVAADGIDATRPLDRKARRSV